MVLVGQYIDYVRRLEALLDRGIVPEALANTNAAAKDFRAEVSEYRSVQHVSVDDNKPLPVVTARLPIGITLPSQPQALEASHPGSRSAGGLRGDRERTDAPRALV